MFIRGPQNTSHTLKVNCGQQVVTSAWASRCLLVLLLVTQQFCVSRVLAFVPSSLCVVV